MQHLRPISDGQSREEGAKTIMIPATHHPKGKAWTRDTSPSLKEVAADVPPEALPSATETPRDYEAGAAIPSAIAGFQPDMDPHLQQVLQALENDAFVDDELGDDFFGELVEGGERNYDEHGNFEFDSGDENGGSGLIEEASAGRLSDGWMEQFARFKRENARVPSASEYGEDDGVSEGRDTVNGLPTLPVVGGKRRRKGASDASGYSLTSSSMFRNRGLSTLDERFAKVYHCPHV